MTAEEIAAVGSIFCQPGEFTVLQDGKYIVVTAVCSSTELNSIIGLDCSLLGAIGLHFAHLRLGLGLGLGSELGLGLGLGLVLGLGVGLALVFSET